MIHGIITKLATNIERISSSILKSPEVFQLKKDKINVENLKANTDNVNISDQARASMILSTIASSASTKAFVKEESLETDKDKENINNQKDKSGSSDLQEEQEQEESLSEEKNDQAAFHIYKDSDKSPPPRDNVPKSDDKGKFLDIKF